MSLVNQSIKAQKLNPVVILSKPEKHITGCRSDSDPATNYQQVIKPIGKEYVNGHKVIIYNITCQKVDAPDMTPCQGNGCTRHICKHSLAGLRAVIERQNKKLFTCAKFENALKKRGAIIKITSDKGYCYGVVQ